ncbi:MAG: hypothetical protein A2X38_08875 [Elusimicrobia bacterium GWC2_61_25]|nr:MAG: hypothetical protein A2X38_08875 [Elusimicrobia bacterium GWC2_61_25]
MLKKLFSLVFVFAAISVPPAAYSLQLAALSGHELPAAAVVPAPPAPVSAAPRSCRPFLLEVAVGGVDETVLIERACTPENEPVWALTVALRGKAGASVRVSSENYPAEKAALEKRFKSMVAQGISQADADFIVLKTGPELARAAAAGPAEKAEILAAAVLALKAHLSQL